MISDQDYELLSAYLDDALPADMRADLEARLPREAALRRELDILRATVDLIHGLPDLKAPRNFTLDASMVRRPAQRWLMFPTTAAFSALSAAAAFVLVALAVVLSSFNASAPSTSPQIAFGNTLAVEEQESPTEITQAAQPAAPFEATEEQATLSTTDGFTATEPLLYAAPLDTLTPDVTLLAAPPDAEGDAAGAGMSVMSAAAVTEEAVTANADVAMSAPAESPTFDAMSAAAAPASTDGVSAMNAAADVPPVAGADTAMEAAPAATILAITPSAIVERAQPTPTAQLSATASDSTPVEREIGTEDLLPSTTAAPAVAQAAPTQSVTPVPAVTLARSSTPGDMLPLILLLAGGVLGALALITTFIRRRA